MYRTTAALVTAAATLASAGNVYVDNRCPFPLYEYSYPGWRDPLSGGVTGFFLPPNTDVAYTEIQFPPNNAVAPNQMAFSLNPQMTFPMQFTYDQNENGQLFYSFNITDGNPIGAEYGFEALTNGNNPPHGSVACPPTHNDDCPNAFRVSHPVGTGQGDPVQLTNNGADFTVRLCAFADP